MRKRNEENERIKRAYLAYLREAKGQDEASLDKVAAALLDLEEATGFRSFKAFHRDWGVRYKKHLAARKHPRSGRPLGLATRDATLRLVKGFLHWLASQPGYKSRISYSDVEYFNNNRKDATAAHAARPAVYPSLDQCAHAFRHMPAETEVEQRDKAIFAALMLTGARDGALASLRLGHVDLVEGKIIQDGREATSASPPPASPANPTPTPRRSAQRSRQPSPASTSRPIPPTASARPSATSPMPAARHWRSTRPGPRTLATSTSPRRSAPTCRSGGSGRRRSSGDWLSSPRPDDVGVASKAGAAGVIAGDSSR